MNINNYKEFLDSIFSSLADKEILVEELMLDHLGYQTSAAEEYDIKCAEIEPITKKLSEHLVEDRRVGIFILNEPWIYQDRKISIIELIEPKDGQIVESGWEHVEFTYPFGTLEDLISKYPEIDWDTSMLVRDEFPMLRLKLENGYRVKFPRRGVLEEDKRIEGNLEKIKNLDL